MKRAAGLDQKGHLRRGPDFIYSCKMTENIRCEVFGDKGHDDFDNRENLYRTRRDDFRNNTSAMNELAHWKAFDNNLEYKFL